MGFKLADERKRKGLYKPKKDTRPKRVVGLKKLSIWEKLQKRVQPYTNRGINPVRKNRISKAGFVWDPKRQDYRSTGKVKVKKKLRVSKLPTKTKKVTYAILKRRALAAKKRDVRYSGSIFGRL